MNILITGANKGIGLELTKLFLQKKENTVIALSKSSNNLIKLAKSNAKLKIIKFDLENMSQLPSQMEGIAKSYKEIDILINNAGVLYNNAFENTTYQQLESSLAVNFKAPYTIIQKLLPQLKKSKSAHIINISSIGGVQGSSKFKGLSSYSPTKAALICLTECLAEELQGTTISLNSLALGAVQTQMLQSAFPGYKASVSPKQMAEYIYDFALTGNKLFNGKVISVSKTNP